MWKAIFSIVVSLVLTIACQATASDMFEINVTVNYDSDEASHVATGMILIPEGDYAHINVVIFENNSLRLSTSQSRSRVSTPTDRPGKVIVKDELAGMIDLSLSPRERKRGDLHVTGELEVMSRKPGDDKPTFEFNTEPLNFITDRTDPLKFGFPTGEGITEIELTVKKVSDMHPDRIQDDRGRPSLVFETEYSLYNRDDSDYEVKADKCLLGSEGNYSEGKKSCSWYRYYPMSGGDSLLYWFTYKIDDVDWISGKEFDVTIDFSRTYANNPVDFDPDADVAVFNDATISLFSKEVRTEVGEVLDIILDDAPEGLPFKGRETIRLISREGK